MDGRLITGQSILRRRDASSWRESLGTCSSLPNFLLIDSSNRDHIFRAGFDKLAIPTGTPLMPLHCGREYLR
jgi:hypothetical protein